MALCAAHQGHSYGYFAASYKLLTEVWNDVAHRLEPVCKPLKTERRIDIPLTGGKIEFWTLDDPDAGRSRRYHEVGIDEAGLVKNLEARWYEAIRPTLTDYRGHAIFAGTPKGRNFFHTAYAMGQDPLNAEWASWQMPTVTNPFIDPEEVEAARLGMPERPFRQEYLAEFLEDAGGVFRGVSEVIDRTLPCEPHGPVSIGVDLARVEDFTVITALDSLGRQIYFERFNQISWERIYARIEGVSARFPDALVWLDSTGAGDPPLERLRLMGIPVRGYQFTNASKEALIDNLAMLIEQRAVALMDVQVQTDELQAYQYELTPSRNVRMGSPEGMHDDTVCALALAAWPHRARARFGAVLPVITPKEPILLPEEEPPGPVNFDSEGRFIPPPRR